MFSLFPQVETSLEIIDDGDNKEIHYDYENPNFKESIICYFDK